MSSAALWYRGETRNNNNWYKHERNILYEQAALNRIYIYIYIYIMNRPMEWGRKPRAGREVPILAMGRRVGAAQVPAHTHTESRP